MNETRSLNARQQGVTTVLTQTIARLLLVPIFMVAAGILVKGYADVGDGFSAGVVAALGIVLQDVTFGHRVVDRMPLVRGAAAGAFVGLTIALLVAFLPLLRGEAVMTHAPGPGAEVIHLGTLELLTAVAFDVGVFLLVFGFAVSAIGMIARVHRRLPEPA
jgi:multisubunit Na+/H+ antiporter MnhB subunit